MRFDSISQKQAEIFRFPHEPQYETLICDGAVRSGKTIMMVVSFIEWTMHEFNGMCFGVCGKTVRATERNIIMPLQQIQSITKRYKITYTRSASLMTIKRGDVTNYFYVFGGKDESSYMLIQGITLAGVLFDEVALMPQSFVEQAIARTLSIEEVKLWFNCNPGAPGHWFYQEWVLQPEKHKAKHLHFLMDDNPGLTADALERAKASFSGVFYKRYVLGEWCAAEGLIYDMFDPQKHVVPKIPKNADGKPEPRKYIEYMLSCDYGTQNATVFLLWGYCGGVWYLIDEYYYSGRDKQKQKTDEEYYQDLVKFVGDIPAHQIIIDPSAASFIACVRRHGKFIPIQANNSVVDGIRFTGSLFSMGKIKICEYNCKNALEEIQGYCWEDNTQEDKPVKEKDHAMDAMRYFCYTHIRRNAYRYGLHMVGDKR